MGGDIKNLRARIKSVDSTLHLTSAMGLVASFQNTPRGHGDAERQAVRRRSRRYCANSRVVTGVPPYTVYDTP